MLKDLETAFTQSASKTIAERQSAYLKNHFPFFGIMKPERAALQKDIFKKHPIKSENALLEVMMALWSRDEREYQYTACDLAEKHLKLCSPSALATIEEMIRRKSWWDTVDRIASNLLGTFLQTHPDLKRKMHLFVHDPNMWIRRSALLFQLKYKDQTDEKRLFDYCELVMHEDEFFIRKAIGWVLREYAKTHKEPVRAFLKKNKTALSPLSYREASKYL